MRGHDESASGSFITAAGLHADEAILNQVDAADGVLRADAVQLFKQSDTGVRAVY